MEQALADIRTKIPDFAGYDDEVTRRKADEQIRAIAGEALALLYDRHREYFEGAEATDLYDRLILRCEFTNQEVFKEFEYEALGEDQKTKIARADETLIGKAMEAEGVAKENLLDYLHQLEAAFNAREAALMNK